MAKKKQSENEYKRGIRKVASAKGIVREFEITYAHGYKPADKILNVYIEPNKGKFKIHNGAPYTVSKKHKK